MKKALIYLVTFIAIQLLAGGLFQAGYTLWKGAGTPIDATGTILLTILANVSALIVFLAARWTEVSRHWMQTRPWGVLFWCTLAALGAIIPSTWIQELMPELPDLAQEQFDMILRDRMGYFVVGLLAPLVEEMVFRGAILRALLKWKPNPWIGIAISAVFFSAVHMNPVQMPHAFLIGLLLGWMYWRTNSIVPGVVYHWVNNTVAYILYNLYPDPTLKLADYFGGSQQAVLMALLFSLCIFLPAVFQLNLRMKK